MTQVTETIIIRLDLYSEFVTLMACARVLVADADNLAARELTRKSLSFLGNPNLYNSGDELLGSPARG
jgi:hypothetical protein